MLIQCSTHCVDYIDRWVIFVKTEFLIRGFNRSGNAHAVAVFFLVSSND